MATRTSLDRLLSSKDDFAMHQVKRAWLVSPSHKRGQVQKIFKLPLSCGLCQIRLPKQFLEICVSGFGLNITWDLKFKLYSDFDHELILAKNRICGYFFDAAWVSPSLSKLLKNCTEAFIFCSTALTSVGWGWMTIKPQHCLPTAEKCRGDWISARKF